ncbi:unnamed protein product [Prunus brigantina]
MGCFNFAISATATSLSSEPSVPSSDSTSTRCTEEDGVLDSAFHFELSEPGYEVLSRLIFTLFEGSKMTDDNFWLNPEIVVMEDTFHLFPKNLPICSTDEAWVSSLLNKVKFGTLKPRDRVPRTDHVGPQVVEQVEVLADSGGPELVQGLLDELEPHVFGWEGLLPSICAMREFSWYGHTNPEYPSVFVLWPLAGTRPGTSTPVTDMG